MLSVDKGNGYHGSGDINTYVQLDLLQGFLEIHEQVWTNNNQLKGKGVSDKYACYTPEAQQVNNYGYCNNTS